MKPTLLIVDDEPVLLNILSIALKKFAAEILTATNGAEALAHLEGERVDCVISDINMPVMDGIELLQRIRERPRAVEFIFFSGHGDKSVLARLSAFQPRAFVHKPNYNELKDLLKAIYPPEGA